MGPNTPLLASALSLCGSGDSTRGLFLLADQTALPRIGSLWPRLSGLRWSSLLPSGTAQPDGATPLLIDVSRILTTYAQRQAINELYEHGRWANCLSLLISAQSFECVVDALRERARAQLPDRFNVLFRYFDTRTMPLLPRLLRPEQYAAFMDCVASWHFVDRHGQLQAMPATKARHTGETTYPPLVFDTAQEQMLIDDGTTDAVIDQLLDQRHPAFIGTTPPEQYDMVSVLVDAAAELRIADVRDVLLYCCAALAHGRHFERRTPWAERLVEHRQGRMTLEEVLIDAE